MKKNRTRAERNIAWCEAFLRIPEGKYVGQPLKMAEFMKEDFRAIYDNPHTTRRAIISRARKQAKALALDTPIPTPNGWTTMGDLQIGDYIFDPRGNPTKVLNTSEIFVGKDCYELTFSDGTSIVASEDHLWETTLAFESDKKIVTTKDIFLTKDLIHTIDAPMKFLHGKLIVITDCVKVDSVPTRCISVDSEDHLFLAGEGCIPTHNTTQSAMILLLHLCGPEATPNSQLYSGAMSRDQASILFSLASKMVRMSPRLSSVVDIKESAKSLHCKKLGTVYKALSADASTAYGLSPKLIIHDETGQVRGPTFDLYTALETATAAQHEPLTIIISTQAPNDGDLLSLLIDDALTGADPKTVLRLNTAPPELDTFSIEAIEAANPAFHVFMNKDEIITMRDDAERMPSKQADYENLILNRRVETKSPFISKPVWQRCGMQVMPFTPDDEIYGGLDLSSVSDLTAKVYLAGKKDDDGNIIMHIKPEFWMPEDGLKDKSRNDKVPYDLWRDQGYVRTTPGKAIDYEYVAHQIKSDFDSGLNIKKIGFDRWNWKHFKPWLSKVGFRDDQLDEKNDDALFKEFGQGYQSMSPALRAIEGAVLNEKLAHGNHPLLAWCVSNAIVTQDPAGNRKLDKAKANGRIDGLVALVMAYSLAETFIEDTQPKKNPRIISIY